MGGSLTESANESVTWKWLAVIGVTIIISLFGAWATAIYTEVRELNQNMNNWTQRITVLEVEVRGLSNLAAQRADKLQRIDEKLNELDKRLK